MITKTFYFEENRKNALEAFKATNGSAYKQKLKDLTKLFKLRAHKSFVSQDSRQFLLRHLDSIKIGNSKHFNVTILDRGLTIFKVDLSCHFSWHSGKTAAFLLWTCTWIKESQQKSVGSFTLDWIMTLQHKH
jgi:hypothetical protein